MPNWLKNLISWLSAAQIQMPPPSVEEKPTEILPAFTAKTLYVNSEIGLNVRSDPEVLAENKIETIPHGQEVHVISERDKWFEIEYSGNKRGWVSSVYLAEEKPADQTQRIVKEDISSELPQFKIAVANLVNVGPLNSSRFLEIDGNDYVIKDAGIRFMDSFVRNNKPEVDIISLAISGGPRGQEVTGLRLINNGVASAIDVKCFIYADGMEPHGQSPWSLSKTVEPDGLPEGRNPAPEDHSPTGKTRGPLGL